MRYIFFTLFFTCCGANSSELAERILELTGAKESYEKQFLSELIVDSKIPTSPGDEFYFLYQEHNIKSASLRERYISWEAVKPLLIKHYDSVYTKNELQVWIDFLSSSVGKSIIEKSDRVDTAFLKSIQTMFKTYAHESAKLSDELQKELERVIMELESRK